MTSLQSDHLSGRFDRKPILLKRQVKRSLNDGATLLGLTELDRNARADAVASIKRIRLLRKNRGETGLAVRKSEWKVVNWGARWVTGPVGPRRGVMLTWSVVRNKHTREVGLVSTAHYPAGVEGTWRTKARAVLAHRRAVTQVRDFHKTKRRNRKKRGKPLDFEIHSADWNLNLHRLWVRTWIRSAWPALKAVPRKNTPDDGSLGPRLIDWFVTRGIKSRRMRVLPKHRASDHRGVSLTGLIKRRKKS